MSLIQCPECHHEAAIDAVACPNCGHPFHAVTPVPIIERKVIIAQPPPDEGRFPAWAFIPIGVLALVLLILVYVMMQKSDETANLNINVNAARRTSTEPVRETRTSTIPPTTTSQPVAAPVQTTTVPGTSTAPPVAPPADKGTVVLKASVLGTSGPARAASGARFYLLDKDLETVLSEARLTAIEGNTLIGSLGLSLVYPDRYGDFQRAAMRAISLHSKKTGTTNSTGEANLSGIEPNQYYLVGITRVGRGFALWDQPVAVVAGQNVMNLSPQSVTEVADPNGE